MLRIAAGVVLGLAVFAAIYFIAVQLKKHFADEEADNPGAMIAVFILIAGSIAAYVITTEVLG